MPPVATHPQALVFVLVADRVKAKESSKAAQTNKQ
jgi:hypothetical protein